MATDLLANLLEATLAATAAIAAVLLLRAPVGRRLGAAARYRLWLLVPLAMTAVLLPAPLERAGDDAAMLLTIAAATPVPQALASAAPPVLDVDVFATAAWLLGALGCALLFWRQQRNYVDALRPGPLVRTPVHPGLPRWRRAAVAGAAPALIGALRPWLLLPADFEQRYDPGERQLVLAHEYQHLRRRDGVANLLATILRVLFWFHPLLHFAAARMRFDQELACDAAVMRTHAGQRRRYADAMLKTQLACTALPIGCHWHATHPLKERVAMLKHPLPTARTRVLGSLAVAGMLGVGTAAAWAAQPPRQEEPAALAAAAHPTADVPSDAKSSAQQPTGAQSGAVGNARPAGKPPRYPAEAIAARDEGKVVLRILVGIDGTAKEIEVDRAQTHAAESLVTAAINAVGNWEFEPQKVEGKPVAGWVQVPIEFSLDRRTAGYNRLTAIPYPQAAQAQRIEGEVVLAVSVDRSGAPSDVQVVHEEPAGVFAADAARRVGSEWRFTPATLNQEAVASIVQVPILFRLGDSPSAAISTDVQGDSLDQLEVRAD